MDFNVLDSKVCGSKQWYLCKSNLMEYIATLKKDFSEFQVQRRIVSNGYLDGILATVQKGEPMPTITLTTSTLSYESSDAIRIDPNNIEILDGLQRTFRLWVFWKLSDIAEKENIVDYKSFIDKLKKSDMDYIRRLDFVNVSYLKNVLDKAFRESYLAAFSEYDVVFVVWKGLNDREIVEKMLILNAGQRPVSSTHQFEILFLHYFDKDKLKFNRNIRLVREKENDYFKLKHGYRKTGEYALSSIIIAIQSFVQAKPLRIAPVNKIIFDEDYFQDSKKYLDFFSKEKLSRFINVVYEFDLAFSKVGDDYQTWFGKDTTLSGVFAGLGTKFSEIEQLEQFSIKPNEFDLDGYNQAYSELSSVHVNVGQRVREAIYTYTKALLSQNNISWSNAFSRNDNNYD